jgi:hypothetical protein
VGLGREGFTQVGSGVGWSAATGVGLSWRSVRESGSSCSERERDEEDDAEVVAEEEKRMVAAGRGLGLRWLRLRRGGERKRKAEAEVAVGGAMAEEEVGEMDMAGWLASLASCSILWIGLPCSAAREGRPASSTATGGWARRGEASQWGGLQRRRGSVRERKGGGTHLSAHDAVVLPTEPRGGRTTGCRCPYGLFRGRRFIFNTPPSTVHLLSYVVPHLQR